MPADDAQCDLYPALTALSGKWKPLILYHLCAGRRRYGELRRAVGGAADKVLIQQLKELEADGIIERVDHREIPPRVDYALSPLGASLAAALTPLVAWGRTHPDEAAAIVARRPPRWR